MITFEVGRVKERTEEKPRILRLLPPTWNALHRSGSGGDERQVPARAALIATMAEKCRSIAGRAAGHLLDPLRSDTGGQKRTLHTAPQIEVGVLDVRRIVGRLRAEERTELVGEVRGNRVAAAADGGSDGGQDGPRIGARDVLEGAHAAARDGKPRASPAGMHGGPDPALGREEQDRHAVRDAHRSGDAGLESHHGVRLDTVRAVAPGALRGGEDLAHLASMGGADDAIAVHLVGGGEGFRTRKTGLASEAAQVLLDGLGVVAYPATEVQAFQRSGRDAAAPERESVDHAFGSQQPRGAKEGLRHGRSLPDAAAFGLRPSQAEPAPLRMLRPFGLRPSWAKPAPLRMLRPFGL